MKKMFLFLMITTLLLSLAACQTPDPDNGLSDKSPEELIRMGKYMEAYKVVLGKQFEGKTQIKLEDFIFLPAQTLETDSYDRQYTYAYTWDTEGKPLTVVATYNQQTKTTLYQYSDLKYTISQDDVLVYAYFLNQLGQVSKEEYYRFHGEINETVFEYDEDGHLIQSTETIPGNDEPTIIRYTYDDNGNLTREEYGCYSDYIATTKNFTYDANGRLIKVEKINGDDGNRYEAVYVYNDKGQLVSIREEKTRNGQTEHYKDKTFTYDDKGRVTSSLEVLAEDGYTMRYTWTYDEYGNVTKEVYASGTEGNMRTRTVEHKGYTAYYVPRLFCVHEEILKSFRPQLDD